ncbi:MAG: hypothetical protein O7I42_19895, partial [Alphaproteobacteria bacterium]|nr:hypothetical protein [Alphaproteobacteria bacterium]
AALQAEPPAATNHGAAEDGVAIIWNGPRVLPSLARLTAATQGGTASDSAIHVATASGRASDVVPVNRDGGPAKPISTGTAAPKPGARPVWLEAAIADARSIQSTTQRGKAAQKVVAQPWITEAMLEALVKYEKLALERKR